jgi:hypothetical protein
MGAEWASATFAGVAAAIAIQQLVLQVSVTKRDATFAHIRDIAAVLQNYRDTDPRPIRQEILDFYSGKLQQLSGRAKGYLVYLDRLDILGLAYETNAVKRRIVETYLRGLLADPYGLSPAFIDELRKCCRDASVYEHLAFLIRKVRDA